MQRAKLRLKLFTSWLLRRARKFLLGTNGVAIISLTANGLLANDPEDLGVGRELRKIGAYREDELERALRRIGANDDVLVVGAHIGSMVIPIAKHCRSVVAIEANPDTFKLLEINLLLNRVTNVRAYNIAASDKTETLNFVSSRSNSGGAKRMPMVRAFEYFYDSPEIISVSAHPLDQYLSGETFSLVFMDIEGSEYFALKGMQNILHNARTLIVEYLPHHLRNVGGIGPQEFLAQIAPHFDRLLVPSKDLTVKNSDFLLTLQAMFDQDQEDDGLVFTQNLAAVDPRPARAAPVAAQQPAAVC